MTRFLVPAVLFATACQTYDFEPVTPIAISQTTQTKNVVARNLKPNLMILVDKSGSMNAPINSSTPSCGNCSGDNCPATCPTRVTELKTAMGQFLSTSATVARMGLAFFPADPVCAPTARIAVDLPAPSISDTDSAPLTANATAVNTQIQAMRSAPGSMVQVIGGTPTGGSLSFLGSYAPLLDDRDNRQDFVLLLTDGLPNCNSNNTLSCSSMPPPPATLCTLGIGGNGCTGTFCRAGYLDKDGVVTAVQQLRSRNVSTIVVGFGADFASPEALDVLNGMAAEGGFGRKCPMGTNAECGSNNTCLPAVGGATRFCQKQFYAAANATELATALADIQNLIGMGDPCNFSLSDRPTDDRFLAVIINGQTTTKGPNTWSLLPTGAVQFAGQLCDRVKSSTTAEPLKVEFRIVSTL
ncbi:MAG: adventurous gliding motility lipoprotein CglB [Myxococcales bacterium]|nr:adventurous gliding motility lipoprotein CglB [Myxococcales bacterium]